MGLSVIIFCFLEHKNENETINIWYNNFKKNSQKKKKKKTLEYKVFFGNNFQKLFFVLQKKEKRKTYLAIRKLFLFFVLKNGK